MKKGIFIFFVLVISTFLVSCSCSDEPLSKRIAKKTAKAGLDAIEGVAEAIEESGAKVGEKAMDAVGTLAEGIGKSVERQLDEHASKIGSVAGRTLVQGVEGLEEGFNESYYNEYTSKDNLGENVALIFIGKIKTQPVVDARFVTFKKGKYNFKFEFYSADKLLLTKEVTDEIDIAKKQTLISFYLTDSELTDISSMDFVKVSAKQE